MSATTTETESAGETTASGYGSGKMTWIERFADRMNPILVKEVRQAMKSRAFATTFMLLIICCWLVSLVGSINVGAALEYYSYAEYFFAGYFIPLTIAICLVVPFLAYNSLQNERIDDTFEMLSITTLNARRIVNGKLTNAVTLVLLCFSAITPFIAFTSLLQGFRLTPVVFSMTLAFFVAIGLCSLALLASSLATTRLMQGLVSLLLLLVLGYITSLSGVLFALGFWSIPASWTTFGTLGVSCVAICFLVLLFREITVARITFRSDNRSTGIRLVTTLIGFAIFLTVFLSWYFNRATISSDFLVRSFSSMAVFYLVLVVLVAYFSCTEPPNMSVRVRQQVTRIPYGLRLFATPWLPGCFRGYLFCLIHVVPLILVCLFFRSTTYGLAASKNLAMFPLSIGLYAMFYAGIAVLISNLMHRRDPDVRSTLVRASFLVIIAFMAVLPHLIVVILEEWRETQIPFGPHLMTCPQSTIYETRLAQTYRLPGELTTTLFGVMAFSVLFFLASIRNIGKTVENTMLPFGSRAVDVRPVVPPEEVIVESAGDTA